MILALDTYYYPDHAKCVGVLFNWKDEKPKKIIQDTIQEVLPYVPGEFFKREMPSLMKVIKQIDINSLECILVDSHVQLNEGKKGLGMYLYDALDSKVPIIGLAKKKYFNNEEYTQEIVRGKSKNPLYVSSIGINLNEVSALIQNMHGEYRIPSILKTLDQCTKSEK